MEKTVLPGSIVVAGDMDTTARMEAALGPSLLTFQRTILHNLTLELSVLYPEVSARTVLDDESIDDTANWLRRRTPPEVS